MQNSILCFALLSAMLLADCASAPTRPPSETVNNSMTVKWLPICQEGMSRADISPYFTLHADLSGIVHFQGSQWSREKGEIIRRISETGVKRMFETAELYIRKGSSLPRTTGSPREDSTKYCIEVSVSIAGALQSANLSSDDSQALTARLEEIASIRRWACPGREVGNPREVPPLFATGLCSKNDLSFIELFVADPDVCSVSHVIKIFPEGTVYYFARQLQSKTGLPLTSMSLATSSIDTDAFFKISLDDVASLGALVTSFKLQNIPRLDDVGGGGGDTYAGGTIPQSELLLQRISGLTGVRLKKAAPDSTTCDSKTRSRVPSISFSPKLVQQPGK